MTSLCIRIYLTLPFSFLSRGLIFTSLLFILSICSSSNVFSNDVIVHPGVEISLSNNSLRSIYSLQLKSWEDGTGITVFILDPVGESHRAFCLENLGVFPYQLQRVWDVMVFSGTGQSPVVVKDEQEMIARITSTPGSIGYVIKSEVPANVKKINVN